MIKVSIPVPKEYTQRPHVGGGIIPIDRYRDFEQLVAEWMLQTFGPERPVRVDNTRARRVWSVKYILHRHTVEVMCRYTEQALITKLKWN